MSSGDAKSQGLVEVNVDAIPGPTHCFGGLGVGNVASMRSSQQPSSPKQAALQGLKKATVASRLGVPQYIWLPPSRPDLDLLRRLGFDGPLDEMLVAAYRQAPTAFSAAFSSAFMWAANSGTFSPAVDCADGRNHFTPANLISSWHRGSEAGSRAADIRQMFSGSAAEFVLHEPLPPIVPLRDEGAANHMRLCDPTGIRGINVFVHGDGPKSSGLRFTPRHTESASRAIAQLHRLELDDTFFVQQHPAAIAAGAFHNDVIATSHRDVMIYHERAFADGDHSVLSIQQRFEEKCGSRLKSFMISESQLSLENAIQSYFFNSQIVTPEPQTDKAKDGMFLVCPWQCQTNDQAQGVVRRLIEDPSCPIQDVHFVQLGQSMSGGGGPACVRLRLQLDRGGLNSFGQSLRLTPPLASRLAAAIEATYPEALTLQDLQDVDVVQAAARAIEALAQAVGQPT